MRIIILIALLFSALMTSCSSDKTQKTITKSSSLETATFAGGCFWCMEGFFQETEGVIDVVSGYTGGEIEDPTYDQVSSGKTKHIEAVQITYDPEIITYQQLLDFS